MTKDFTKNFIKKKPTVVVSFFFDLQLFRNISLYLEKIF